MAGFDQYSRLKISEILSIQYLYGDVTNIIINDTFIHLYVVRPHVDKTVLIFFSIFCKHGINFTSIHKPAPVLKSSAIA